MARPLILVVIDGLTPSMLEGTIGSRETPVLAEFAARGTYRRATSVFPSLTPVCLSSIATGAHGDVHEIPHLVWYDRGERRLVEYGSSFGAVRAAGIGQTLRDTLVNLNRQHLGTRAVTLFESLADAGLRTAAVNFTVYRGRTRHQSSLPFLRDVKGPERFFFYNLFSSDRTGAPLSWRNRPAGSIDAYATAVGRWLVTRDAFDFLVFYLSDYDYASHEHGPDSALEALQRCDASLGSLADAAGGIDALPPFPLARILFPVLLLALPVTELAPPLVLAGCALGVQLPSAVLVWMLVAMAALLVGWAAIYQRAGRSPLHALAFPLGAAVLLWIFVGAIARGRRVSWKGRDYTIA